MIDSRLQTLRALAEEGTVTAAAAALHLTPSTVSQQLRQLASELGVQLLEPQGRRVRLTAAAHTLLEHTDALYAQWEQAIADLERHRTAEAGHLRITGVATALVGIILPAVQKLRHQYPQMTFDLGEDPNEDRFQLLLIDRADIAVIIPTSDSPPPDDGRYEQHALLEEPQDLLVPADHPLARRKTVRLDEAAKQTWIQAGDPRDQHQLLLSACAAAGFTPRLAHNAVDWIAVATLVANGHGISLLPRLAALTPNLDVKRIHLSGQPSPTRRLLACVRRGSTQQLHISRGLTALREAAKESAGPRRARPEF